MTQQALLAGLAGILASAAPIVFLVLGETITERAGVINLSLNGVVLLSAMAGFAVALNTNSIILGFLMGAFVSAIVALIVAFMSITLEQSQVAVGFVLALLTRDLAYFLGSAVVGERGLRVPPLPIPGLVDIPIIGTVLFRQNLMVYLSFVMVALIWFFVFRTRLGLMLRGIGERPEAAYVRGVNVNLQRYLYTVIGGAICGLAGPAYSLSVKAGWQGTISGLDGIGWIALAITIFGGWSPLRAALGAYLFAFLQWLSLVIQPVIPAIPSQVLQVAPFPLMILTLLFVNIGNTDWLKRTLAGLPETERKLARSLVRSLRVQPPAALGTSFKKD